MVIAFFEGGIKSRLLDGLTGVERRGYAIGEAGDPTETGGGGERRV